MCEVRIDPPSLIYILKQSQSCCLEVCSKRLFLRPWPPDFLKLNVYQTWCLQDQVLSSSTPFTIKFGCAPVRQPKASKPSHLTEEPETWDCFHVQLTLVRSCGERNCGKWRDKVTEKAVGVPQPWSASSDTNPCQCLWGLSGNICQCAGSNLQVRRVEPLADFVVRLPWDSSINVCLLFVCWVLRGIFWAFSFFFILILKTNLGYVLLRICL